MGSRRILIGTAVAGVVCAILFCLWRGSREPRYMGKSAAEWFKEFRAEATQNQVLIVQAPNGPQTFRVARSSPPSRSPASDALRAMGTNALPYLVRQLRRPEPIYERLYSRFFLAVPRAGRRFLPNPPTPVEETRRLAALAIAALGARADGAAPALLESLKFSGHASEYAIMWALRAVRFDRGAADQVIQYLTRHGPQARAVRMASELLLVSPTTGECLLEILSNTNNPTVTNAVFGINRTDRLLCVRHLGYYGKYAPTVIPGLIAALKDPDPEVRVAAANVLEEFGPAAAPALPALEQALKSDDSELRYLAARAIEAMGTNALTALPVLMQMTNDSFVPAQTVSKRIIEKLDRR